MLHAATARYRVPPDFPPTLSTAGITSRYVFLPQEAPEWKEASFNRLAEILAMPSNWDGYGMRKIPPELVSAMATLLGALPNQLGPIPPPIISPASDGLQIEWNGDRRGVEIILGFDGKRSYVVEREGRYEEGMATALDPPTLSGLLERAFGQSGAAYQDALIVPTSLAGASGSYTRPTAA